MRFFLVSFIFILLGCSVWGQKLNFDSLEVVWQTPTVPDSLRLDALHQIIRRKEIKEDTGKALALAKKQLAFAVEKSNIYWEGRSLHNIGHVYKKMGDYENALSYYFQSLEINDKANNYEAVASNYGYIALLHKTSLNDYQSSIKYYLIKSDIESTHLDSMNIGDTFYKIALNYRKLGDFPKSLEFYLKGIGISEQKNDQPSMVIGYTKIGNLFINMKDLKRAEEWYLKGLEIAEELKIKRSTSYLYNNLGNIYLKQEKYDLALDYYKNSLTVKERLNDQEGLGNAYSNLGRIHLIQKNHAKAYDYFERGLRIRKKIEIERDIIQSYTNLGDYHIVMKQYDKAIDWCDKALSLAEVEKELDRQIVACKCLSSAYEKTKNYKEALRYHQQYSNLSDAVYTTASTRKVTQIQSSFKYEKEINAILKTNEKQEENYKNILSNKSKIQYTLIAIIVFLVLFTYFFYKINLNRKRANEVLNKKNKQIISDKKIIEKQAQELKTRDELKTRFFTHISHELRTPLTLILGPIGEMIKSKNLVSKDLIYAQLIENNTKNLLGKINEILSLTKLDNGLMELNNSAINLYPFIKNRIGFFQTDANQKGIKISLDFQLDKKVQILLDKNKFEQIINNYISNALKYTSRGGKIRINLQEKTNNIILSVEDTGQGIHPKDITHIFSRFYQAKYTEVIGGTGIGLALCKEMASLMEGEVSVESSLGEGTTFYFRFPLIESFEMQSNEEFHEEDTMVISPIFGKENKHPKWNIKTIKILLVEDNQDLRTYIKMVLSNYEVTTSNNGKEALQAIESAQNEFDLIISDLMMPEMDGFQLLKQLKSVEKLRQIPVIILSARADWSGKLEALELGVDDYILKPFKETELLLRIHNLLQNKKERKKALSEKELDNNKTSSDKITEKWMDEVAKIVQQHKGNSKFKAATLAKLMNYSERQLSRRLKEIIGLTPSKYIRINRLQYARELLEEGKILSVSEVAYTAGFETPQYFTTLYEAEFGKKPIEYLR